MTPDIGTVCYFAFKSDFQILNGVYRVQAETSFTQAIKSGIDFTERLYKPVGLGSGDYLGDLPQLGLGNVLILEPVDGGDLLYIPTQLIALMPDPTVKEYYPLSLAIDLGVHRNTQTILPLIAQISDMVAAALGITDAIQVLTNSRNRQYLTDDQYQTIVDQRAENIGVLVPLSVQLKREKDDNQKLKARIAAYESLLVQLGQQSPQ